MKNIKTCLIIVAIFSLLASILAQEDTSVRECEIDQQAFYSGTPSLETKRLRLRQINLDDAEAMFAFTCKPEVETWDPIDKTIDDTKIFIESLQKKYEAREPSLWGIVDKQTNKLIGYAGFTYFQPSHSIVELEYALDVPYWNQGIMPEALAAILSYSFNTLKINRILAFVALNNQRSENLLLKIGMRFEGHHREAGYSCGRFRDLKSYALLRQEYLKQQTKNNKQ